MWDDSRTTRYSNIVVPFRSLSIQLPTKPTDRCDRYSPHRSLSLSQPCYLRVCLVLLLLRHTLELFPFAIYYNKQTTIKIIDVNGQQYNK